MRKFLLWDQDGVLVDTERWFIVTRRVQIMRGVVLKNDRIPLANLSRREPYLHSSLQTFAL